MIFLLAAFPRVAPPASAVVNIALPVGKFLCTSA